MEFRERFERSALKLGVVTAVGASAFYAGLVGTQVFAYALNCPASTKRGNLIALVGISLSSLGTVQCTTLVTGHGKELIRKDYVETGLSVASCIAVGAACFALLGGRVRSVLPSHYCFVGGFAKARPAMRTLGEKYADQAERGKITLLGTMDGCHTCGTRSAMEKYIADHQPPNLFAKHQNARWPRRLTGIKVPQYFYAQCEPCSRVQSVQVNRHMKWKEFLLRGVKTPRTIHAYLFSREHLKLHVWELRAYHLAGVPLAWWWVWSWSLLY